jgi:hypothetical protein
MSNYYVYSYSVPGEDHPFYIGKGKDGRWLVHLKPCKLSKRTHFYCQLKNLLSTGAAPIVKKVLDNLTEQQAFDLEKFLIKFYGRLDLGTGCLCNHTDGGEGAAGYKHTPAALEKMAAAAKNISSITRQKMSKARRERVHTLESNLKRSAALKGKSKPLSHRLKHSIPVESYNLDTGGCIKKYPSALATNKDGYSPPNVVMCTSGIRKSHKGVGWRKQQGVL